MSLHGCRAVEAEGCGGRTPPPAGPQPTYPSLEVQVQHPAGSKQLIGFVFLHTSNSAKILRRFRKIRPSLVTPIPPTSCLTHTQIYFLMFCWQ